MDQNHPFECVEGLFRAKRAISGPGGGEVSFSHTKGVLQRLKAGGASERGAVNQSEEPLALKREIVTERTVQIPLEGESRHALKSCSFAAA